MRPQRSGDVGLVVIASLAFATASPLGKASAAIPAVVVASARTGLAALVLFAVAGGGIGRALAKLTKKERAGVALAGALLAAHFAFFLGGLGRTSLAAAVALVSLEPIAVVLASFVAFGSRPTRREVSGLALATAGAFVVASGAGQGEHRLAGDLMVLVAVVLFGAYVAAARGLRDALPATAYAASVYAVASIVLLPLAIPLALAAPPAPAKALASVIGLALVPTLVGHSLVQRAARRAPPVLVALVCPGETLGSLAIGAVVMGTSPTVVEGAGAALIVAGATLAMIGDPRARSSVEPG